MQSRANRDLSSDPLHRSQISATSFGGLSMHTVDVVNLEDFAAEASMPASLSLSFVLNGSVTMATGGNDVRVGQDTGESRPEDAYLFLAQPGQS